jgi:branched-chain amino acid transport system permease protein
MSWGAVARAVRRMAPLAIPSMIALVIVLVTSASSPVLQFTVTTMLINLIVVVGLYVFVGNSGILSFGHIGFMAIGAYTSAILTIPHNIKGVMLPHLPGFLAHASAPTPLAILISGLVAAVFALLVSLPLMRMSVVSLPIATLALLVVVYQVTAHWVSLTRGYGTMLGVPIDTTMFSALVWAVVAMALAFVLQISRYGLRMRACREEEVAARAVGIGVAWERTVMFVASAFIVGTAGALYAHELGSLAPDAFYFGITFTTIAMLIVGGSGSLAGAFTGTVVISAVSEGLRRLEGGFSIGGLSVPEMPGLAAVALGVIMLLLLTTRSSGITGGREFRLPRDLRLSRLGLRSRFRRTSATADATQVAEASVGSGGELCNEEDPSFVSQPAEQSEGRT